MEDLVSSPPPSFVEGAGVFRCAPGALQADIVVGDSQVSGFLPFVETAMTFAGPLSGSQKVTIPLFAWRTEPKNTLRPQDDEVGTTITRMIMNCGMLDSSLSRRQRPWDVRP
jgi:hypothetical protein